MYRRPFLDLFACHLTDLYQPPPFAFSPADILIGGLPQSGGEIVSQTTSSNIFLSPSSLPMRVFPQPGGPVCIGIKPPFPLYAIPPIVRAQFILATNLLNVSSTAFREAILTLAVQLDLAPLRGGRFLPSGDPITDDVDCSY